MVQHRLVVYEKKPRNAALVARATNCTLHEVRSVAQLRDALVALQPHFICFAASAEELIDLLQIVHDWKQSIRAKNGAPGKFGVAVAMADLSTEAFHASLYEAGVDAIFGSIMDLNRVTSVIRRAQQHLSVGQGGHEPLKTKIWSRLPWKRHASGGGSKDEKGNNGAKI